MVITIYLFVSLFPIAGTNTTIIISGGEGDDGLTASTYAMTLSFNKDEAMRVSRLVFTTKPNYPTPVEGAFASLCHGKYIVGGGRVYTFDHNGYHNGDNYLNNVSIIETNNRQ